MKDFKSYGDLADHIVQQMLKGIKGLHPPEYQGRKNEEKRRQLCQRLRPFVIPIVPYVPQRQNAAVGAVLCKCAIKYGLAKAIQFSKAVNHGSFNGHDDPAHLMWLYFVRAKNFRRNAVYATTVTAMRAYCENRKLVKLSESATDILDWSDYLIDKLEEIGSQLRAMNEEAEAKTVQPQAEEIAT